MKYGYQRVSTKNQARDGNSLEAQSNALKQAGAEIIYSDAFTGAKAHRPELDKLMAVLQPGDSLIVTKLDRIARSALQGTELIQHLLDKGITVHVLNMGIMDNTPTGKLIRSVMLAFAEFERDMIIERTSEGKAIARLNPAFRDGRPLKYSMEERKKAFDLLQSHTYKQVEEMLGISKSTLMRIKKDFKNVRKTVDNIYEICKYTLYRYIITIQGFLCTSSEHFSYHFAVSLPV